MPSECAVTARHQSTSPSSSRQARLIDVLPLKHALANQAEHLGGFLGQAGARVEQAVALVERRVDGAERGLLILVERHGAGGVAITHS